MAHSVGEVDCQILLGTPPESLREGVNIWSVMGHDGAASLKTGKPPIQFPLTVGMFGTAGEVTIFILAIEALQSFIVDVVYDNTSWDKTYSNIEIKTVGSPPEGLTRERAKESGVWKVKCLIDIICVLVQ